MGRFTNLPTPKDLMSMKEDLEFKEDEMKKSEMTTIELAARKSYPSLVHSHLDLFFRLSCDML